MSGWLPGFLIALAPLLLLVALLLCGRYPGESTLHRLRRRVTVLLARAGSGLRPRTEPFLDVGRRGGRLIASSLAGRGPPFTTGSTPVLST